MATALAGSGNGAGKTGVGAGVPQLGPGVERLGEYQGSGFTQTTYLARCPGGHVVQLSRLLYLVLGEVDGVRTATQIADRVRGTAKISPKGAVGGLTAGRGPRRSSPPRVRSPKELVVLCSR